MTREKPKNLWLSRWGFILAATGSAVGLGNIWKFPYITGEYGGGAFVLMYLACILAIGIPVMMTEIALGRRGRGSPIDAIARVVRENNGNPLWRGVGLMAMLAGFMILCFYVVVAGWAFAYTWKMLSGALVASSVDSLAQVFEGHNANPWQLGGWSVLVSLLTLWIVGKGVQAGVERAFRWMMPGLAVMLLVLVGYAWTSGSFRQGFDFLFTFDATKLTGEALLAALGHAFFTLSLASGAILTYGSYLPDGQSIARTTFVVAIADTCVALLAGLAIFPVIFANGMSPSAGPGLIFMSLPLAFQQMPMGTLFGVLFFAMVSVAALTSAISMIEAVVAYLNEKYGVSRGRAALASGAVLLVISLLAMLSFNVGAEWKLFGTTLFDGLDYLTSRWMMPLGGILMVILAGYCLRPEIMRNELGLGAAGYALWLFMVRYVSPVLILMVFLNALGWLSFDPIARWYWIVGAIGVLALVGELLAPRVRMELVRG
ncbi:sodium-dependent transporter [Metapseudomonas furukawaii]|jgi:NSS family neurotransmitter:Na+ symporter|uniref:sodium-dependent transporter n=1 Tax=Metapseudomonas furukawaii TaxID=1149133 RepID=UPI000B49AAAD|nr:MULTISPECIES: sodium-dependent transporter [Pseudomonas]OWJ90547.1 sodium-dependent transporter [Pseudomonas sp. A46]WAG77825.1 sodium-dependent transporter [Pseudomonas furukawaii]